ncbi:MAG: uncharacterized membrane protein (UPF0127 family) [Ulvibacter sp.]|jgi:uncharacterized membrane protein (UPF0127 family)
MKKYLISAAVIGAIIVSGGCKEKTSKVLTQEVIFKKEGELRLKKLANDSTIARLNIEIADDEYQTQTGLMYRKSMKDDQAMLFIFEDEIPRAFYMKNTQFALDIIFIDSDRKVVNIHKDANPLDHTSLPSEGPAQYVLEVNAGLSNTWTLESGDFVEW